MEDRSQVAPQHEAVGSIKLDPNDETKSFPGLEQVAVHLQASSPAEASFGTVNPGDAPPVVVQGMEHMAVDCERASPPDQADAPVPGRMALEGHEDGLPNVAGAL